MDVRAMSDAVGKTHGMKPTYAQVKQALDLPTNATGRTSVPDGVTVKQTIEALAKIVPAFAGSVPSTTPAADESPAPRPAAEAAGTKPPRNRGGKGRSTTARTMSETGEAAEPGHGMTLRPKQSAEDEARRVRIADLMTARMEFISKVTTGAYEIGELTKAPSGGGFNIHNPITTPVTGRPTYIRLADYQAIRDKTVKTNTGVFRALMDDVNELVRTELLAMSYLYRHCRNCGDELFLVEMDLDSKLQMLYRGSFVLPGTPGTDKKEISFTGLCTVCRACKEAVVDLEIELQGVPGDDPTAIARRTDFILGAAIGIFEKSIERRPALTKKVVLERLFAIAVPKPKKRVRKAVEATS